MLLENSHVVTSTIIAKFVFGVLFVLFGFFCLSVCFLLKREEHIVECENSTQSNSDIVMLLS